MTLPSADADDGSDIEVFEDAVDTTEALPLSTSPAEVKKGTAAIVLQR